MSRIPPAELLTTLDAILAFLEADENRFYIAIDIAHQLRDEVIQVLHHIDE
jgi:CRISPR/Cas system-associated endonuclease Cas1